jgi:hypothetical protein
VAETGIKTIAAVQCQCRSWVISGQTFGRRNPPLSALVQKRTNAGAVGLSAKCQLTQRETKALQALGDDRRDFLIKGQFPRNIGEKTLEGLVEIGLAEKGPSARYHGEIGFRITADGWRAQFGMSYEEIMASGKPIKPLSMMRWPIE